jgi:hypothetical protein
MSLRSLAAGPNIELYGSFHLAGAELALPVAALQEVVNHPEALTPVPLAPPYLLGLFNLRGTLIPVVDLRQLLNLHAQSTSATRKVAIVETGGVRVGLQFAIRSSRSPRPRAARPPRSARCSSSTAANAFCKCWRPPCCSACATCRISRKRRRV